MSNLITSPVGEIKFMALSHKVRKKPGDEEATVYTMRLEFEGTNQEALAFKEQLEAINPSLIGTKTVNKAGNFTVNASSKFEVKVLDSDGNQLTADQVPSFPKGSTGQASMVVKPYTGNSLGGTINLIAVGLKDLNLAEATGSSNDSSHLDELRAKISSS